MIELMQARHRVRTVRDILLRERKLLRQGKYQDLAEIGGLSERAAIALLNIRRDVAKRIEKDIAAIKDEAEKNRMLISAALKGVALARTQIDELNTQSSGLGVYTSAGSRLDIPVRNSEKSLRY